MASLTHVAIWTQNGWKRISAQTVAKGHPGGSISAHSGMFMCELCGQYVRYVAGDVQEPHFRHSAYEESKNCPERTFGYGYNYSYIAGEHELPIRIKLLDSVGFEFELGFVPVPKELLNRQTDRTISIKATQSSDLNYTYSFHRLNKDAITYLPIGSMPCSQYIVTAPDEIQNSFWPKRVRGIPTKGAVFDGTTKRLLPEDADVAVGKDYYLLIPNAIYRKFEDVSIQLVTKQGSGWNTWYLYSITATDLTQNAAQFFLRYACRLTKEPISIQPIWPVYIQSPYVIRHKDDIVWLHIKGHGEITTKPYPATNMTYYPYGGEIVYSVNSNARQQLVSTGRVRVLEYTYLWKDSLDYRAPAPSIEVVDKNDVPLECGLQYQLPIDNFIKVTAPFDGTVLVKDNGFVIEKRSLKAQTQIEVDDIHFGIEIVIIQGLDTVWQAQYQKEKRQSNAQNEMEILRKLQHSHAGKIPIPHTISAVMPKLKEYPQIRKWLLTKVRSGYIEEDALKNFKRIIRFI